MSLMCMAPGFGLRAQDAGQESSDVKLEPKENSSGKWGFVDKQGNEVIPFKYEDNLPFSEGLAAIRLDGKWGFVDKQGNEVIPCKYGLTFPFIEGLAAISLDGKWGFVDKQGNEVIPCKYERVNSFSEGLAAIKLDGKWGFVDKQGNEVIPCKYGETNKFSEGLAKIKLDGKWGLVDKTGKEVTPFKYDHIGGFSVNGKALVELGATLKQIDRNGTETEPASQWPGLPTKINKEVVVDFTIGNDESGNTLITAIGAFTIEVTQKRNSGFQTFVPLRCAFVSGGREYTFKTMSISNFNSSMTFNFETTARPEAVTFYLNDKPDEKIRIECKEQQTAN